MVLRRGLLLLMFLLEVSPVLAHSGGLRVVLPNQPQPQAQQDSASQGAIFPWKAGDAPPPVAGVHLGDDRPRLETVLGKPSDSQKLGDTGLAFTYGQRGVQVLYTPTDGAAIIYLLTRAAGNIRGVRLGDTRQEVVARLGDPSSVAGPMAFYRAGDWTVFVKLGEDRKVKQLGIGRVTDQVPAGAKFYRKNE